VSRPPLPPAFFELRERAVDRAPWPHTVALAVSLPERREPDWAKRVAFALHGRLAPGWTFPAAPIVADRWRDGTAYNWGDDAAWLDGGSGGIFVASECFGALPGDGVDVVYHVVPDGGARVLFEYGTDYTQNDTTVVVSASDGARLDAVCAAVSAVFVEHGYAPPTPCALPVTRRHG